MNSVDSTEIIDDMRIMARMLHHVRAEAALFPEAGRLTEIVNSAIEEIYRTYGLDDESVFAAGAAGH